jgi:hypothetical protein
MKNSIIFFFFFIFIGINTYSQQNVSISDVPATPNPTSVLDVSSTNKGMLIPRMTTAQRNAIVGPANGLLVFDTDVNCVMFYSTTVVSWNSLCSGTNSSSLIANTTSVLAGANCAAGGVLLEFGNDTNGNGLLDISEVTASQYVCNGVAGATGPAGPQGPIGLTGPIGATGPQGPIGLTGATGISCWDINGNGVNDPSEDANADGIFNTNDCTVGIVGPQGPAGATGATGPQGPIGLTGPAGATGATGPQGPIGLTGPAGPAGATGATGPQGPIGLTGPAGATGATGPQGPIGLTGPAGATGATGPQGPIGLTGPAGPTWTITSDNFTSAGNLQIITTAPQTVTSTNQAWLVGGNNFGTSGLPYKFGTISNDHVDLISNNLVRGRLSNLGEFFIGTTNTTLAGDLMNGVSNATFPWAINGYSSFNGAGVYGAIMAGNSIFGGVQGESSSTVGGGINGGSGVRGTTYSQILNGVNGQRGGAGANTGWGGLFQSDLGYTGTFATVSDKRIKKDINTIKNATDLIKQLRGVTYLHRLDEEQYSDLGLKSGLNYGFIAQEVEEILPSLVVEKNIPHINSSRRLYNENKPAEMLKAVSYIEVVPILVEGMKEQQKLIEELQKEIELLKIKIKE